MAYPCGQTTGHICLGPTPSGKGCANWKKAKTADSLKDNPTRLKADELAILRKAHPEVVFADRTRRYRVEKLIGVEEVERLIGATHLGATGIVNPQKVSVWTPPTEEEQQRQLKNARWTQPTDGQVPAVQETRQVVHGNPYVESAVMGRSGIVPADYCERCEKRAQEFKEDGTPILSIHHMLGRKNSDRVETASRICSICHDAITRGGVNGPRYNQELIDKIGTYYRTKDFATPIPVNAAQDVWAVFN